MKNSARISLHNKAEDTLIVINLERRVQPTLKKHLASPRIDEFPNLPQNLIITKGIPPDFSWLSIKPTKLAPHPTHIGVINNPSNHISNNILRMLPPPY
jgi:hypothetical protein